MRKRLSASWFRKCLSASSLRKCLSAGASCALALSPAVPLSKGAAGSIKRGYGARVECSVVRIHCSSVTLVTTCAASRSNPPCAAARRECDGGDEGANASRVIGRARAEGWGEQSRNLRKCLSASSLRKCLSAGASCALASISRRPHEQGRRRIDQARLRRTC